MVNIAGNGPRAEPAEFIIGGSVNVALLNSTKAMADIGIQQGVRVNAVSLGLIAIDRFTRNVARVMHERGLGHDRAVRFLLTSRGPARVGTPREIGSLEAYLASVKADFIHGLIIDIDGGATRS